MSKVINKIFNTGVDDNGVPLLTSSHDKHWTLIQGPGITQPGDTKPVYVLKQAPLSYYFNPGYSNWVWSDSNGLALVDQPYVFQQKFFLEFDSANLFAQISVSWGADNWGFVTVNMGSPASWAGEISLPQGDVRDNFARPHDFSINNHHHAAFVLGQWNTLEIWVFNADKQGKDNPSAFNVSGSGIYLLTRPEAIRNQGIPRAP
jgi:hypothetical protein